MAAGFSAWISLPRSPKQLLVSCLESSTGQSRFVAQKRDLGTRIVVSALRNRMVAVLEQNQNERALVSCKLRRNDSLRFGGEAVVP